MPLFTKKAGDCRGTEVDGSFSKKWCQLCYTNGSFVDPSTTLPQMIEIVDRALKEQGSNPVFRWLAKKQIPSLERWKNV